MLDREIKKIVLSNINIKMVISISEIGVGLFQYPSFKIIKKLETRNYFYLILYDNQFTINYKLGFHSNESLVGTR